MADLAVVYIIRVDGDMSDAENLFVSKRITGIGAEYRLTGPLAKAIEAAINTGARINAEYTQSPITETPNGHR